MDLTGAHHLLAHVDDIILLGKNKNISKKNIDALLHDGKEVNVEENADEVSTCISMSRHQTRRQVYNIKAPGKSFENEAKFKYPETTLTNQNSIHEEIMSTLVSRNACCNAVQNLLSFRPLSKNVNTNVILILPDALYVCVKSSLSCYRNNTDEGF